MNERIVELSASKLLKVASFFLLISCQDRGQIQFSPRFENLNLKTEPANICELYPAGFSADISDQVKLKQSFLESRLTNLLLQFVNVDGLVDYSILLGQPNLTNELDILVGDFSNSVQVAVPFADHDKANWINLYNLATLQLIAENYDRLLGGQNSQFPELKSIQNINNLGADVWNHFKWATGAGALSLNEIESQIRRTGDPRIHFALNCASKGCPPLLKVAFIGADLNRQLNERTCRFVNSGEQTIFDNFDFDSPVVFTSQIMEWYKDDFGDVRTFFNAYLSKANFNIVEDLLTRKNNSDFVWAIQYDPYSWELNEGTKQ